MGCCTVSAKLFLTFLGLCFTFAAACLMYAGILVFSGYHKYDEVYDDYYVWVPGATILTASLFMFILGLIACCAACRENKCLLACFFTILLIIVMMELTAGIVSIVYKGEMKAEVHDGMKTAFDEYGQDDYEEVTESIDNIQETLKCCGVEKYSDWFTTPWGILHLGHVPKSCCKEDKSSCSGSALDISLGKTYKEGCYSTVERKLDENLKKVIGVSIGLLIIQVIGLIFSCVLFCNKKKVAYTQLDDEGSVTHGYKA